MTSFSTTDCHGSLESLVFRTSRFMGGCRYTADPAAHVTSTLVVAVMPPCLLSGL